MSAKPHRIEIRSYNVGFGDCFLLSFEYANDARHVLIDFGSTEPPGKNKDFQLEIAKDIRKVTGGKLHAVVATHRHKDHISGFATNKQGTASGNIIRELADAGDALVIQPWTEDPEAPTDAKTAKGASTSRKAFVQELEHMHAFAEAVTSEIARMNMGDVEALPDERLRSTVPARGDEAENDVREPDFAGTTASKSLRRRIAFIGEDNVKNLPAVRNLMEMSTKPRHRFVFFGADSRLEKILPGVKVHVLGPPTIAQHEEVQKQRRVDPSEFWMLRQRFWRMQAAHATEPRPVRTACLFPNAPTLSGKNRPRTSRWFVRRVRGARAKALLELVLAMDDALNNTSVILLFEVGKKKLLFPGDAQIENWEYALGKSNIRKLLRNVDVYKVGHHGSRNATPKTLWGLFAKRSTTDSSERLTTIISTKANKHGGADAHTEVPRRSLVAALKSESTYLTTQTLRSELCNIEKVVV